jgi:Na+/H+ antiporter NhaD/arsenite permease-like protein
MPPTRAFAPLLFSLLAPSLAWASGGGADGPRLNGIPIDFFLFVSVLLGVALFHHHTLQVAVTGAAVITAYKLGFTSFDLVAHLGHEWIILTNLFLLLVGFSLLANHFEESKIPEALPRVLPDDWKGGLVLLWLVFFLSSFLDNIAAAMIGATVAASIYNGRVHIGYLAAIIAASNAGGSGSVVGDTTTTMMWLDGVSPFDVTHAWVGAIVATIISSVIGARQQQAWQPIQKDVDHEVHIDWARVGVVGFMLTAAVAMNIASNVYMGELGSQAPWLGIALWAALLAATAVRSPDWGLVPDAARGSFFLLSLVMCASMMPVSELPAASWQTSMGIGYVSAVFDNIPLTALALHQGGYDWGILAMAVGYGGSMVWFGSSAGVAVSNKFPEARSTGTYLRHGWHVVLGYTVGFLVMIALVGWHPHETHKAPPAGSPEHAAPAH